MLIIDDLLLAPFKGVWWIFKKIHQTTVEELENQQRQTRSQLSELYMQLETGKITEEEFDQREKVLLDRLDQIKAMQREERGEGPRPPPGGPG